MIGQLIGDGIQVKFFDTDTQEEGSISDPSQVCNKQENLVSRHGTNLVPTMQGSITLCLYRSQDIALDDDFSIFDFASR